MKLIVHSPIIGVFLDCSCNNRNRGRTSLLFLLLINCAKIWVFTNKCVRVKLLIRKLNGCRERAFSGSSSLLGICCFWCLCLIVNLLKEIEHRSGETTSLISIQRLHLRLAATVDFAVNTCRDNNFSQGRKKRNYYCFGELKIGKFLTKYVHMYIHSNTCWYWCYLYTCWD